MPDNDTNVWGVYSAATLPAPTTAVAQATRQGLGLEKTPEAFRVGNMEDKRMVVAVVVRDEDTKASKGRRFSLIAGTWFLVAALAARPHQLAWAKLGMCAVSHFVSTDHLTAG